MDFEFERNACDPERISRSMTKAPSKLESTMGVVAHRTHRKLMVFTNDRVLNLETKIDTLTDQMSNAALVLRN